MVYLKLQAKICLKKICLIKTVLDKTRIKLTDTISGNLPAF